MSQQTDVADGPSARTDHSRSWSASSCHRPPEMTKNLDKPYRRALRYGLAFRCFQKSSKPTKSPKAIGPMAMPSRLRDSGCRLFALWVHSFLLLPGCRTSAQRHRPARCWHLGRSIQQRQQQDSRRTASTASRCPAFLEDHLRLPSIRRKHPVADEAIAVAHHDRLLADQLAHGLSSRLAAECE